MVCLTLVMMSTTAGAQQTIRWQGVVKPSEVNVYSDPSTHVAIATTLRQGDVVDVLEINEAWCQITSLGQSEPLGYVLRMNLDRTGVASSHVTHNELLASKSSETKTRANLPAVQNSDVLTNNDILSLSKMGLSSKIVVAKINSSKCNFDTSAATLQVLKGAGLDDSVILAMVESSTLNNRSEGTPRVAPAAPINSPAEPGMYVATNDGFTKILGQILEFERSGSVLISNLTYHIKTEKQNMQLLGAHAQCVTGSNPEFYFIPAKQESDAGVNAGDLILIRLEQKKERRQIEVGAQGIGRASKGISLTHQVQLVRSEVKPSVYKVTPAAGLNKGEYALYLSRGEGMAAYIYDFAVQ